MPKKIDEEAIVRLFSELKNGREVARRLGCHENSVYSIVRVHIGNCRRCGDKVAFGKTSCKRCMESDIERSKQRRSERRRLGVCIQCGEPRCAISALYCEEHRITAVDRSRASRTRTRNGSSGLVSNERQKLRTIRDRYGEAGLKAWERDGGKCTVCGVFYETATIHLHHIDENQANNVLSNLVCLCFECHNTTHRLMRLRNLPALIEWFGLTYPDHPIRKVG